MPLLPSILTPSPRAQQPFILLQSSAVTSCLPIVRNLISSAPSKTLAKRHVILFSFLYPPDRLVNPSHLQPQHIDLQVHDWTDKVPGYYDDLTPESIVGDILDIIDAGGCMHT